MKNIFKHKDIYIYVIIIVILVLLSRHLVSLDTVSVNSEESGVFLASTNQDENINIEMESNTFTEEDNNLKEEINIEELEGIINSYIDQYSIENGQDIRQSIGLAYHDLSSGEEFSINPDKQFVAASTYKVMVNIAAYTEIINGNLSLDQYVYYNSSDYEEGGSVIDTYSGEPYTVQELLDASIIYSDNIASRMLYRILGGWNNTLDIASRVLGIDIKREENYQSAYNLKVALEYIYNNRKNEHYNHLLNVMTQTIHNDRLDKYLPKEIVAHKVGMYDGYIHDVGIVMTDKPYIISIFTEYVPGSYEFIAELSKIIYEYQLGVTQ